MAAENQEDAQTEESNATIESYIKKQETIMMTATETAKQANFTCSLPFAQRRMASSITSTPFSFGAIFSFFSLAKKKLKEKTAEKIHQSVIILTRLLRRTIFLLVIPVYWFIIFQLVLHYFDIGLFMFIVGLSYVFSTVFHHHWGLLEWGMRG